MGSNEDIGSDQSTKRRSYLKLLGAGTISGLAGCSGGGGNASSDNGGGGNASSGNGGGGDTGSDRGGHLRVAIGRTTETLNPVMMGSKFTERWAVKMFYSTLTRLDADLEAYGDLAEDWSSNDSADEWTFTLRDATFHDGSQVTAADVKATFETVYDDDVGSPGNGTMGDIQSIEAVDDQTVRFTLGTATSDFNKLVAKGWGSIIPKSIVDQGNIQSLGSSENGSGAFVLDDYASADHVTGVRYEDYYRMGEDGEPLPYVDKATQQTIPESSSQINALRNQSVDIIWEPDSAQWGTIQNIDGANTMRVPAGNIANFIMDVSVEPWSNENVRNAVMLAIDREAIIQGALDGIGTVGQDSLISSAYQFFADVGTREQNLEEARNLLAEAGYPNGFDLNEDFGLTFYSASSPPYRIRTAVLIKEQLKQIGITFDIQQISYDQYISDVWTKAPCYMGSYGMRISGANFMKLLLHSNGGWNSESHFSNQEFDKAIDNAISATDDEAKQEYMTTAQQIVRDHGPYAVPFYTDQIGVANNYVMNYSISPLTYLFYPDEYALGPNAPTK
jgi:peptide/nickel transport system substrate-binding protein